MNICVVIMAYNEASNLETVVREVRAALDRIDGDHEVLIVDDGSGDQTGEIARTLAGERAGIRVVSHSVNQGLGGVYRTGFSQASGDLLTFWPADGQFDPEIISRFASRMGTQDLVLGTLPNRKRGLVGGVLSLGERGLYRFFFGRMPRFQGIFMVRRSVLDSTPLVSDGRGWAVVIEMIIRVSRTGHRVVSVPTDLRPRQDGHSKVVNLKTITSNLRQIVELRARL